MRKGRNLFTVCLQNRAVRVKWGIRYCITITALRYLTLFYFSILYRNEDFQTPNMNYYDSSYTFCDLKVEGYINSLPIESDMKEKLYNDLLRQSYKAEKVI